MRKIEEITLELSDEEIRKILKEEFRQKVLQATPEYNGNCTFKIFTDFDKSDSVENICATVSYSVVTEIE